MKNIKTSILVLICSLSFTKTCFSQSKVIDSLNNELSIKTQKDTLRVNILNSLAYNYRRHDISIAEEKSIEANNLAKELNYKKGIALSILMFSKIHISKGEFDEALTDAQESLKLYKEIGYVNQKDIGGVYNTLGMIYNYQNDSDTSVEYFKKSLKTAKSRGDLRSEADMLNNIGITYYSKGDLDEAISFYKKAIDAYENLGKVRRKTSTLNNIGIIYSIQGKYTEALEIYNKILIIDKEDNNTNSVASTLQNMGIIYSNLEQYQKAYSYFEDAYEIYEELENKRNMALSLNSIGGTLVHLKDYEKGLKYLNESLALNKEVKNNESQIANYNSIGNLHITLDAPNLALNNFKSALDLSISSGDRRNMGSAHINLAVAYFRLKDYSKALHHCLEGKKIVDDLDIIEGQKQANGVLSEIYETKGELKKSLDFYKKYKKLNDSIFNKKNIEKITQLEYEYKYKQAIDSASIRELKLTKTVKDTSQNLEKTQRNLFLGVIAFLILALVLAAIIFFLKIRNEKTKTQSIAIEQKLLRSQMTPHFIFNSMSVLQGMILNKEDKKAIFYLSKFSKLLRITLENSRDKMVILNEELEAVSNYLELQNLEDSDAFKYTILVDEIIDTKLYKVPPMLIQPFIENAIEHAFKNQRENKRIDIQLKYLNKELICTITDNGIGINTKKEQTIAQKKSLATTITSERLKVLSKDFKMNGSISIEDRKKYNEQGTIVTLVIPYKFEVK